MALYKFSKTKTFHVEYCGCTAASNLLDETSIRLALKLIRDAKSKHEFVKTTLSISKDGVNIIYENDQKFSTKVPAANIAGSSIGKSTFNDTFGKKKQQKTKADCCFFFRLKELFISHR